nr:EamA family transporter [Kineococcus radiotolerans]
MRMQSNATVVGGSVLPPPPAPAAGLAWGALGVLAFSLTIPLTRVAVGGLDPLFTGAGRAVVAAALAGAALLLTRAPRPTRRQWRRLALVAGGVVAGFPLLTSFALTSAPAAHGAVVVALLPAATAVTAVLRTGERPSRAFWAAAAAGAVCAVAFAARDGGPGGLHRADLLLFAAVLAAAVGYTEGGLLARELGAWPTISWALVLAAPAALAVTAASSLAAPPRGDGRAVGRLRLPGRGERVPGVLRLVPRAADRADGPRQPGPARATRPDHRLGRAAARRTADRDDRRGGPGRRGVRRPRRPHQDPIVTSWHGPTTDRPGNQDEAGR